MTKDEIITKYVWNQKIYGSLMKGNISREDYRNIGDNHSSIEEIKLMISQNGHELIDALLEIHNWRGRTVAGCLIGFKNQIEYIPQIEELFLNHCGGVTGYCYAFAKIADEHSVEYLMKYLDENLVFEKFPVEKFQEWAFSSLRWTDKVNGTELAQRYLGNDGLWTQFVNFEYPNSKGKKLGSFKKFDLDYLDTSFENMMTFYNQNFEA